MVDIAPLSPELQATAIKELFEVPSRIPEDLNNLKLWISKQPHLKVRNNDQFLLQFLRGSKYSLEKAKERLDLYYTLKSKYPELFVVNDVNSPEIKEMFGLGCVTYLPKPLNDCGPRIAVCRFNYTASKHRAHEVLRCFAALLDWAMVNDPYVCIYGEVNIIDMSNLNANHLLQYSPGVLKKSFAYFAKTVPFRIKAFYFIKSSPVSTQFLKLVLPFFPDKLRQRVFVCGSDMKELTSHLPLQYLPQDYGGENGSLDELTIEQHKNFVNNANYFKDNDKYGVDESLRPGKPMDFDSIYGMEGSFRKLEVD